MAIVNMTLENLYDLEKKDFLVILLLLLVSWLVFQLHLRRAPVRQQYHSSTTPVQEQEVQNQEVCNAKCPSITVSNEGRAGFTVGILHAHQVTSVEQHQDVKEPPPDFKEILCSIQDLLRKRYKTLRIKGLPWLPEVSFKLDDCYVHLALTDRGTKLDLEQIFNETKKSIKPKRVLVEGGAGFGKTTLTCKLCYDWANNADYMVGFYLVIVLHLRCFKKDFKDTLATALGSDSFGDIDTILDTIAQNADRTLLVLEGYDEIPPTAEKCLFPILWQAQMKDVTVLVTSRPGKFMVGRVIDVDGHQDVEEDLSGCFDKKITIVGLLQEHQQEFLGKHLKSRDGFSSKKLLSVRDYLDKMVPSDFLACPLFLLMLVRVFKDGNITKVKTKTDIFKHVLNFIMQRFLNKTTTATPKGNRLPNADLFRFDHRSPPSYVTSLSALGMLAIDALEKDKLIFTQDELQDVCDGSEMLLQIGVLNPTAEVNGIWSEVYYEPVHKSLLEFLAAYSMWISFLTKPDSFFETFYSKKSIRPSQKTVSSLAFPFLCGLFGESCCVLFDCLTPFIAEYSHWFGSLCFGFNECKITTDVIENLNPLFPVEWRIPWYNIDKKFAVSSDHQNLLESALLSGKTKVIRWFMDSATWLPNNVQVKVLFLVVGAEQSTCKLTDCKYGFIRCTELWCDLRTPGSCNEDWSTLMELIGCIEKETISFMLCNDFSFLWLPFIHQSALAREFGVTRIDQLHCWLKRKQRHTLSLVHDLVQTENVCQLNLLIIPPSILTPIFDVVRNFILNMTTAPESIFQGHDSENTFLPDLHLNATEIFGVLEPDAKCTNVDFRDSNPQKPFNRQLNYHSHTVHPCVSCKSSNDFGSAAAEYITSLAGKDKQEISLPTYSCDPTAIVSSQPTNSKKKGMPVLAVSKGEQDVFGSATTEFISSFQLSASCASHCKEAKTDSSLLQKITDEEDSFSGTRRFHGNSETCLNDQNPLTVSPEDIGGLHDSETKVNLTECCSSNDDQFQINRRWTRDAKVLCATVPHETSKSASLRSDTCFNSSPLFDTETTKSYFLSSTNNWMKTFDDLSVNFPRLVEDFGVAFIAALDSSFGSRPTQEIKYIYGILSSAAVVKDDILTLCDQTRNLVASTSMQKIIHEFLPPTSPFRAVKEALSKLHHTSVLVSVLHSAVKSKFSSDWLENIRDPEDFMAESQSIAKEIALSIRWLLSTLNVEANSAVELGSNISKYDRLLLLLKSLGPTLSSSYTEARNLLTEAQSAHLQTVVTIISDLLQTVFGSLEQIFFLLSNMRTLSTDNLLSVLSKMESLSSSVLSIIEDNTYISVLKHLLQAEILPLSSILSLVAELLEDKDETYVDVMQLEWIKDVHFLSVSYLSSLFGLTHATSPIVDKALNLLFECENTVFSAATFIMTVLLDLCGTKRSEMMETANWETFCRNLFSSFHVWTSNLLQQPTSTGNFNFDKLIMMLNPINFGVSSSLLRMCAALGQYFSSCSRNECDFLTISQSQFDALICCASKSEQLTSFTVTNIGTLSLNICADVLCSKGYKSWRQLKINGHINLCFHGNKSKEYIADHLDVRLRKDVACLEEVLTCFRSQSLHCTQELLMSTVGTPCPNMDNITELKIYLTSSACDIVTVTSSMKHIQTLALMLTSFDVQSLCLSVKGLLSDGLKLKRLEIWNLNKNPTFASNVVKEVAESLIHSHSDQFTTSKAVAVDSQSRKDSTTPKANPTRTTSHKHQLDCLMLHLELEVPVFKTTTSIFQQRSKQSKRMNDVKQLMKHPERSLLDLALMMKHPLRTNKLANLELVCTSKPPLWEDTFPYKEGFVIEHSMIQIQTEDNAKKFYSHLAPLTEHQFTVSFKPRQYMNDKIAFRNNH